MSLDEEIIEYKIDNVPQNTEMLTESLEEHFSSIKLTKNEINNLVPFKGNSLRDINM
ncbi:hypothetical protein SAMN04487910_3114 [Aquimarina amphilecti]|uniref:Uncharacterized protein n=2 Tax=Aquimarina amphilecti TaxID=1038014 RepID=A0A1H7SDI5_AQUAM|nr:hypothetical protein SAMN04487910_3114 [Aquimarina amphilecti]